MRSRLLYIVGRNFYTFNICVAVEADIRNKLCAANADELYGAVVRILPKCGREQLLNYSFVCVLDNFQLHGREYAVYLGISVSARKNP